MNVCVQCCAFGAVRLTRLLLLCTVFSAAQIAERSERKIMRAQSHSTRLHFDFLVISQLRAACTVRAHLARDDLFMLLLHLMIGELIPFCNAPAQTRIHPTIHNDPHMLIITHTRHIITKDKTRTIETENAAQAACCRVLVAWHNYIVYSASPPGWLPHASQANICAHCGAITQAQRTAMGM